jgi:hypothetical protein
VKQAARIGRDRFQVAALRLGIERAEGERGFARARHAGEHDQRVARKIDVDILEIVLARAAHAHEAVIRLTGETRQMRLDSVVHGHGSSALMTPRLFGGNHTRFACKLWQALAGSRRRVLDGTWRRTGRFDFVTALRQEGERR